MIEQVISSIREAEDKADVVIKESIASAKKLVSDANTESQNMRANAVKDFAAKRNKVVEKANKEALSEYENEIEKGKKEAEEIEKSADKNVDKAAKLILQRMMA